MESFKYKGGGGESCAVKFCTNSRKKLYLWDNDEYEEHKGLLHKDCPCLRPYKLHVLPKAEDLQRQWKACLNRKNPPKYIRVCSAHFIDGRPTMQNPIPKLGLGYEKKVKEGRKLPSKRQNVSVEGPSRKRVKRGTSEVTTITEQPTDIIHGDSTLPDTSSQETSSTLLTTCDRGTSYQDMSIEDHGYAKALPLCDSHSKQIQTNKIPSVSKATDCKLSEEESVASQKLKTDTDSLFLAGVTLTAFLTLVKTLKQFNVFSFTMPLDDQILLVLIRLRHDQEFGMLARTFNVSTSYASKVFNSWIAIIAEKLGTLIVWLPRETLLATLPKSFSDFPKTTCIIDCAETFIQRPLNLKDRAQTFSNYKSHNTAKYLVGASPHGQIMFISRSYGGRASDKTIVNDCGFLDYIRPGDEIMADRGFTIEEELFARKAKLVIPAFTKGQKQLSANDVTKTRRIANVRIHIERAIRRLKVFRILSGTVPVSSLKKFEEILIVCAALVNLRPLLIREKL